MRWKNKLWAGLALVAAAYLYNGTPSWPEVQARIPLKQWSAAMSTWLWPKSTKLVSDERAQAIAATRDRFAKLNGEHADLQRNAESATASLARASSVWASASSGCDVQGNEAASLLHAATTIVRRRAAKTNADLVAAINEEKANLRDEHLLAAAEVLSKFDIESQPTAIATGPQPMEASVVAR